MYKNPQTVELCQRLEMRNYINDDGIVSGGGERSEDVASGEAVANPDEIVVEDSDDE